MQAVKIVVGDDRLLAGLDPGRQLMHDLLGPHLVHHLTQQADAFALAAAQTMGYTSPPPPVRQRNHVGHPELIVEHGGTLGRPSENEVIGCG